MKERPILFSAPMVRAILDGRKTQFRRVVKPQPEGMDPFYEKDFRRDFGGRRCPYGVPGDRLWVRETWFCPTYVGAGAIDAAIYYHATDDPEEWRGYWKPSIHMPRAASRITLEVVGERVERVQEISREDAHQEGFWASDGDGLEHWNGQRFGNANEAFRACWNSLNAKRGFGWDKNLWVWVIEFRRVTG